MWRSSVLVGMMLLAGGSWADEVLYRTQQAVDLGASRTDIRLDSNTLSQGGDLSTWKGGVPLALVLSGVWASKAPSIGYQIYLNVPPGVHPQSSDPGHLGDVSFYDVPDHYASNHPKEFAFFLDEVLARLGKAGRLSVVPTLTLIPLGADEPGVRSHIEEVSIVVIPR